MSSNTLDRRAFLQKGSLACAAVLSASVTGCDIGTSDGGEKGDTLSGTVLSFPPAPDGEVQAVEDVVVSLLGTEHTFSTDADGTFALENVEPGSYDLRLEKSGFLTFTGDVEVPEGGKELGELRYPKSRENVPIQSATFLTESDLQEQLSDKPSLESAVSAVEEEEGVRFDSALAVELEGGESGLVVNYEAETEERYVQVADIPTLPRTPIRAEVSREAGLEVRNAEGQLMMRLGGDELGELTIGVGFTTITSVSAPWASTQSKRHTIPKDHGGRDWSDSHGKEMKRRYNEKLKENDMFDEIQDFIATSSIEGIAAILALLLTTGIGAVIGALAVLAIVLYNLYDIAEDLLELACETVAEFYCTLVRRNQNDNLQVPFEEWKQSWLKAREAIWNCIQDGTIEGEVLGNPHQGDDFGWRGANLPC